MLRGVVAIQQAYPIKTWLITMKSKLFAHCRHWKILRKILRGIANKIIPYLNAQLIPITEEGLPNFTCLWSFGSGQCGPRLVTITTVLKYKITKHWWIHVLHLTSRNSTKPFHVFCFCKQKKLHRMLADKDISSIQKWSLVTCKNKAPLSGLAKFITIIRKLV